MQIRHARRNVGAKPRHDGPQLGVYAQVVVVAGSHSNETAGLALKRFDGEVVEEILEGAGEGGSEDGGAYEVHV